MDTIELFSRLTHSAPDHAAEKTTDEIGVDVRMCKDCKHTIFSKAEFASEIAHKPPDVRAYENLVQFERGIRLLLPKFQRLLGTLQYAFSFSSFLRYVLKIETGTQTRRQHQHSLQMLRKSGND